MDSCLGFRSDWNKKRQQAQPYINRIRSALEKKTRWSEQIGFLRKCLKEGLTPKGLRVRLPGSILLSQHGKRLRMRSEKRVVKRTVSNLFVKLKSISYGLRNCRLAFEAKILLWFFEQLDSEHGKLGFKVFGKGEK